MTELISHSSGGREGEFKFQLISGKSQRVAGLGSAGHITIPELITGIKALRVVGAGAAQLEQTHGQDSFQEGEPLLPSGEVRRSEEAQRPTR